MNLDQLKYNDGARHKKKRIGRGEGSGWGMTAGRGEKGYGSRAGSKKRSWFEGGQMPLQRRLPKFGFTNTAKKVYQVVNVSALNKFTKGEVNNEVLFAKGLIRDKDHPVKILGNGELKSKLNITVHAVSNSAREKIEQLGGTVTLL